jgi:hypothetical protein
VLLIALVVEVENYNVRLAAVNTGVCFQILKDMPSYLISFSFVVTPEPLQEGFPMAFLGLDYGRSMTVPAVVLQAVLFPLISIKFVR